MAIPPATVPTVGTTTHQYRLQCTVCPTRGCGRQRGYLATLAVSKYALGTEKDDSGSKSNCCISLKTWLQSQDGNSCPCTPPPAPLLTLHTKHALYERNGNGRNMGITSCLLLLFPFTQSTVKHISTVTSHRDTLAQRFHQLCFLSCRSWLPF